MPKKFTHFVDAEEEPSQKFTHFVDADDSTQQPDVDVNKVSQSLIYSRMFNVPPSDAYQYHDELQDQLNEMGVKGGPSIADDFKVGAESSIFGMLYRGKLPDTLQNPNMLDSFVEGLTTMVADLPVYLAGGAAGGVAGSEVPIVGNIAGAAMGSFALPSAMRKAIISGYKRGTTKSFGELMDWSADVALAGAEGAATGLVTHGAGLGTLPFENPAVGVAMKRLQQVAAMTIMPDLFEGRVPTAKEFAINAALFTAMHYGAKGFGLADIAAGKVHEKLLDIYEKQGTHPADIASEALRLSQQEPDRDPIDRLNEITRTLPEGEEKPEDKETAQTVVQEEEPGLRPAIKSGNQIIEGSEGEKHDDVLEDNEIEESKDTERGFVDAKGNFYTRDEAKAWVRQNEPQVAKNWERVTQDPNAEFHSEDYNEARTGIKNAAVDAQRKQMGLAPIQSPMRTLDPDNWDIAKENVDSGRIDPLKIAESINENPRNLSAEETNALNYYRAQLSNQHEAVMNAVEQARQEDNPEMEKRARERLDQVEENINTVDMATKRAGTEWALSGIMRQRMIAQDYSLDRLVQRARIASKTGVVSPEVRDKLESLSTQLEAANKALEEYRQKQAERDAQSVVEKIKQDTARTERKGERAEIRVQLKVEFENQVKALDKLLSGRLSANPFIDPEILGALGKLARNRVEFGLTKIGDIVDDIHGALTNIGYDVTRRDIRDAISGYGKTVEMSKDAVDMALREARAQGRLVSALEDAQQKQIPLRSGLQRDAASDEVRELQRKVKGAMKESGIDVRKSQTPETQWRTALESVKTRLSNQIADMTKQLKTGETEAKRTGIVYDDEANALKEQRDHLKELVRTVNGDPKNSPEQKIKMATASVEKQIQEYERRIKENDLTPMQRRSGMQDTPQLKSLRERADSLRETYRQMKEAAQPKKTPEQIALDRFKKYTQNRIDDMTKRLETGDFSKEPARHTVLDPKAVELKTKAEKIKRQVDDAILQQKLAGRSATEKIVDNVTKWRRFGLLTGWGTLGKLTNAAMQRMGATPVEELMGGVLSHIPGIDEVSKRAPMQGGGLNISAEVKAVSQLWQKATAEDMWETIKTGQSSLDLLFGGKSRLPQSVLDFVGHLHGALKVPEVRAEFFRRMEIGLEYAKKNNLDVGDPRVQSAIVSKIEARAYDESLRAKLMQENVLTKTYQVALSYLHNQGLIGRGIESGARIVFPMVTIATNLPAEALAYTPVGLAGQTVALFKVLFDEDRMGKSAMDNLSLHDMDNIMRGLKKGSVGLALSAIGFAFRNKITGYYLTEEEKKRGVKRGIMTIGGVTIPSYLNDTPPMIAVQLAATVGHVWDHYQMKGMSGGLVAGGLQSGVELAKRIPFYGQIARDADASRTPEQSMTGIGGFLGGIIVPRLVSELAENMDKQRRSPKNFTDAVKMQIPGLREKVPVAGRKKNFSIRSVMR